VPGEFVISQRSGNVTLVPSRRNQLTPVLVCASAVDSRPFVDALICYKQKCNVVSLNLGHPVYAISVVPNLLHLISHLVQVKSSRFPLIQPLNFFFIFAKHNSLNEY